MMLLKCLNFGEEQWTKFTPLKYLDLFHAFVLTVCNNVFVCVFFPIERESAAATALPGSSVDGSAKTGSGRGGRKKYHSLLFLLY